MISASISSTDPYIHWQTGVLRPHQGNLMRGQLGLYGSSLSVEPDQWRVQGSYAKPASILGELVHHKQNCGVAVSPGILKLFCPKLIGA